MSSGASFDEKMDLTRVANQPEYLKSLIFLKKDFAIKKLIEIIPHLKTNNFESKTVLLKIFPVFFGFAEVNSTLMEECLTVIRKIKNHPGFENEKRLFDGWEYRLNNIRFNRQFGDKRLNGTKLNNDISDVIGYSDLDFFSRFNKWLKYHKLHKYLYFFANLSHAEILNIESNNIRNYERKVDLHEMTEGGRNAILRKLTELGQRSRRLEVFSKTEYYNNFSKVEKAINEIKCIMKTPIRKNTSIPDLLIKAMETVVFVISRNLSRGDFMKVYNAAISLLKSAWACSFFDRAVKNKLNVFQSTLHTKLKSDSKKRVPVLTKDKIYFDQCNDVWGLHVQIENGIRAISLYLEELVLEDF